MKDYSQYRDQKFGMLTFTGEVAIRGENRKRAYGKFICDCGNYLTARMDSVVRLDTQSCGCVYHDIHVATGKKNIIKAIEASIKHNEFEVFSDEVHVKLSNSESKLICDLDDWKRLKEHCWHLDGKGYARTNVIGGQKGLSFHRAVMNVDEKTWIDHRNRNRLDCRKSNLREATPLLNAINYTLKKNNTSGHSGVYFDGESRKWRACIHYNNKKYYLGRYHDKEDAIKARQIAEDKYFRPILET